MILRENIKGRIIKIEIDDDLVDAIETKFFVNLKYRLFLDKLYFDSFKDPLILHIVHPFEPYGKREKLEKEELIELMREKGIFKL